MKRQLAVFLGLAVTVAVSAQERTRHIDNDMLEGLRRCAETSFDVRFLEKDMLELSLDQTVVDWADTTCTYRVRTSGITDQKKSGRCWYFSVLNILRAEVMAAHGLDHFEFSPTYGQFWDIL